jgi:hypothetical protein
MEFAFYDQRSSEPGVSKRSGYPTEQNLVRPVVFAKLSGKGATFVSLVRSFDILMCTANQLARVTDAAVMQDCQQKRGKNIRCSPCR